MFQYSYNSLSVFLIVLLCHYNYNFLFVFFIGLLCPCSHISCDSADHCAALGFNNTILKCTNCKFLNKFNLNFLQNDCLNCCLPIEEEIAIKRYSKARLEVCTCKFGAYPQIQAFVKSNLPNQYPNLQIRYVHGRDPMIKLIDDSGEVKEVVAIEKWNTDSIDEFLRTHLLEENNDFLTSNLI